jgi:hypothetical protein
MHKQFKMGESEPLNWYLGIKITKSKEQICLDQIQYIKDKLKEYDQFFGPTRTSRVRDKS